MPHKQPKEKVSPSIEEIEARKKKRLANKQDLIRSLSGAKVKTRLEKMRAEDAKRNQTTDDKN